MKDTNDRLYLFALSIFPVAHCQVETVFIFLARLTRLLQIGNPCYYDLGETYPAGLPRSFQAAGKGDESCHGFPPSN